MLSGLKNKGKRKIHRVKLLWRPLKARKRKNTPLKLRLYDNTLYFPQLS